MDSPRAQSRLVRTKSHHRQQSVRCGYSCRTEVLSSVERRTSGSRLRPHPYGIPPDDAVLGGLCADQSFVPFRQQLDSGAWPPDLRIELRHGPASSGALSCYRHCHRLVAGTRTSAPAVHGMRDARRVPSGLDHVPRHRRAAHPQRGEAVRLRTAAYMFIPLTRWHGFAATRARR